MSSNTTSNQLLPDPLASSPLGARLKAAGIHLCISLGIAAMAALLVFAVWYPYPYREISSGRELFLIVVCVDVILGPLLTLAIFSRNKPKRTLVFDLSVIALLQLAALAYGLFTVYLARPVHLVFEYDRFRVVHLVDVPVELEEKAGVSGYPMFGPTTLGLRAFTGETEKIQLTMAAINGHQLSMNPGLWQAYEKSRSQALQVGKPMAQLKARFASQAKLIDAEIGKTGRSESDLLFVPMIGRKTFWTVLIDSKTAEVLGFVPLDSF